MPNTEIIVNVYPNNVRISPFFIFCFIINLRNNSILLLFTKPELNYRIQGLFI